MGIRLTSLVRIQPINISKYGLCFLSAMFFVFYLPRFVDEIRTDSYNIIT